MKVWNPNFGEIPLGKKVYLLCKDKDSKKLYECLGVITVKQDRICAECIEGDPRIFYNSTFEYWHEYYDIEEVPTS